MRREPGVSRQRRLCHCCASSVLIGLENGPDMQEVARRPGSQRQRQGSRLKLPSQRQIQSAMAEIHQTQEQQIQEPPPPPKNIPAAVMTV